MRTRICDLLDIKYPIVGFTPSPEVAAAISRRLRLYEAGKPFRQGGGSQPK